MPGPYVVEHDILDYSNALRVCLVHELAIVFVAAKALVYLVVVGGTIAVIRVGWFSVLDQRCWPDHGEAHASDIVQMLAHAHNVAAVPCRGIFSIDFIDTNAVDPVIAIRKAVWHNQVDEIVQAFCDYGTVAVAGHASSSKSCTTISALRLTGGRIFDIVFSIYVFANICSQRLLSRFERFLFFEEMHLKISESFSTHS